MYIAAQLQKVMQTASNEFGLSSNYLTSNSG